MEYLLESDNFKIRLTNEGKLSDRETHDFVVSETCGAVRVFKWVFKRFYLFHMYTQIKVVTFHGTTRNAAKDGKECIRLD